MDFRRLSLAPIVAVLLLLILAPASAIHWDPEILVTPSSIAPDGTVTFTITGGLDCSGLSGSDLSNCLDDEAALIEVQYTGIRVFGPDGTVYFFGTDIVVPSGDSVEITFGTFAPDAADWSPDASTALPGTYGVDFVGEKVYDCAEIASPCAPEATVRFVSFDVFSAFEVPEFAVPAAVMSSILSVLLILRARIARKA